MLMWLFNTGRFIIFSLIGIKGAWIELVTENYQKVSGHRWRNNSFCICMHTPVIKRLGNNIYYSKYELLWNKHNTINYLEGK